MIKIKLITNEECRVEGFFIAKLRRISHEQKFSGKIKPSIFAFNPQEQECKLKKPKVSVQ